MEENRSAPRFKASFPVEVGRDGGLAIDVSSTGVAFESDRKYAIGEEVTLRLLMNRKDSDFPLSLKCRGRVVRVEHHDGIFTIGATVEWLEQEHLEFLPPS